jgi:integrase/recombinase XerD
MMLSQVIRQYVDLKQGMGCRFHTESVILKAFCKALGDIPMSDVTAERVMAYITGTGQVTRFWHRKLDALRGLYRFAVGRGYAISSPLPKRLPSPHRVFTPYIYSLDELQRLMSASNYCVSGRM